MDPRYEIHDCSELLSPSLLVYRDLVRDNLQRMIAVARGARRLRPHVKTHKMAAVVKMAGDMGIHKHKCATIAETEMVAAAGGSDALLAYPLVGPNVRRFARLIRGYPTTIFRAIVDNPDSARALSQAAAGLEKPVPVLVDLEIGMGRTGIDPGDAAAELYGLVATLPNLMLDGLHAYDGQIHDTNLDERRKAVRSGQEKVLSLRDRLMRQGLPVQRIVIGGTPSFPIHAELELPGLEISPGTIVLQDHGYASTYPDLPFVPAALRLTRLVTHPSTDRL